jgi:hypothetical protein
LSQGLHQTNNTLKWGNDVEAVNHNQGLFVLDEQSTTISKRHPLTINGFDDERAFDYYQMMDDNLDLEAGNAVEATHSSAFWLEFYPLCKSEDYDAKFLQVKPSAGKEHFPLDIDSIINLVKSVILSCGIELAADSNDQQLSDAELETIVESAQRLCTEHRTTFYQINDMKIQMQTSLENAAKSNNRTAFDSASTTALNSCNEYCEIVLKRIGNLLITITKMTCFVGWRTNEFGPFLMEQMVKCWEMFNITLFKLIEPTMQYRGSVLQLCRRPGVVPLMASDKMMRDRFTKYLHTKIAMIEKLITFLDETLINPNQKSYRGHVHQAPSPLARLCVLEAFMSYSYKSQNSSVPNIFSSEEDEVGFVKLLAARVCLSQQVLKGATKSNIETKERDNFLEVKALYASIVKTVVINEADYQTAPEFIKAYHDGVAKERAKADRRLKFEPEEYSPELISSLMHTSQLLTMEWIYVLCMRQSYSHVEFALPSRLENWMESITGSNITLHKFDRDDITTRCDGAGAKRRVSSILAVLLYRWLETRCFEWHAELTQNELLTAVDFDSVVAEGVAKSGKKKKSKKKAGGGKPIDVQREPIPEPTAPPPEDDGTKSEHAQNSLVGKDTNETELQPSSPNAVDEDIDDAEEKSNSKPKSICSIDVVNVDAVVKPTLLPEDQKNDQPVSKKAKAKKTAGNGGPPVVHNASSAVNTTKTSAASVVDGSSNVHTTNENNDHENFIKVERSVTKKTTSSQTPTNGSNKVIASSSSENKSEQSSQLAKGLKQTPGVAREPKSTLPPAAKSKNQVAVTKKTTSSQTPTNGSSKVIASPRSENKSEQSSQPAKGSKQTSPISKEPKSTLPPAAKSTNKVANSSTSKEVQKTTQLSDPKQVVKQSPAISVKKIHSSDQSAPSKPTAANKGTATVDFSNASPATNINETPHATRPSRAKPLASKTEKAVKPSEAKPNTKQTVKSNFSEAPVTIPAAQQTKRATEPPETDTKATQVPVYKNSDTSSGNVPMQTPLDENHQSVEPAPKETLQVDTEHEDTSNEKVHSGSTQADETPYLQPRVGVIDNRGNIISAEEFLVGRMESLLTEIEEIKSRYTLWF